MSKKINREEELLTRFNAIQFAIEMYKADTTLTMVELKSRAKIFYNLLKVGMDEGE